MDMMTPEENIGRIGSDYGLIKSTRFCSAIMLMGYQMVNRSPFLMLRRCQMLQCLFKHQGVVILN
jgi:hypothetical protein